MSSHDDEERDEVEEYEISNLLSFFKKNNIGVNGIFTFEGRTIYHRLPIERKAEA